MIMKIFSPFISYLSICIIHKQHPIKNTTLSTTVRSYKSNDSFGLISQINS